MAAVSYWRRLRQRFSISAPRMAVRTHLGWPWRVAIAVVLLGVIGGMWWWGFDFGQIFSGFNRKETEAKIATLESALSSAEQEARALRERSARLESDLAMAQGTQAALQRQTMEVTQENAQLKEELAFLQQLFADSNRVQGLGIQRLTVEREGEDGYRYRVLVVRGGNPKEEFDGYLTLQAELVPVAGGSPEAGQTLMLPDDLPEPHGALRLRFKYYQRVEGILRVPPGLVLRALTARAYENGGSTPRATRSLTPS